MLLIVSLLAASCADANSSLLKSGENSTEDVSDGSEIEAGSVESAEDETENNKEKAIADLVEKYNDQSENDLEYIEDFDVSDKDSGHYRTEFRLNAFSEALGKSYKADNSIIDIISYERMFGGVEVRVYADNTSFDLCIDLIKFMSLILDEELSENELDETINYITDRKTANGYYYGNLGLTLFGGDADGYDLMLKTD